MSCNYQMKQLNLELTTECPLGCPQCYCTLNKGKHLDKNTAIKYIAQGAKYGIERINLSGGETLCYPYLYDIISCAASHGIETNIALSGIAFNTSVYHELMAAGVNGIFVSLNGSSAEVNNRSRRGFGLAVSAIDILGRLGYKNTTINWVMQSSNADDFENMINFAEAHHVARLVVIGLKPDSNNELKNLPSRDQMIAVSKAIRNYHGSVNVGVESCFSPLLALVSDSFLFGNTNVGMYKGCTAGICSLNLNVEGLLSPCRHLNYFEEWNDMKDYWEKSRVLKEIREVDNKKKEPCINCKYCDYCRHCLAINANIQGNIFIGDQHCRVI